MIVIESIRLKNFRAVREAYFRPETQGITGIFGRNGAGKTTFLTATLFALFGVRPPGVTVGSLRRENSGTETCSVSVVFQHLGQTVEVIRELRGSSNRVVVDILVDGMPQTVTSVGAADSWMSARLGVDAQGFLTAFIVRQKELDALVHAKPSERKLIIEKLAGIDTINDALKNARKDENTAKTVLANLPGSETQVTEWKNQVIGLREKTENIGERKTEAERNILSNRNRARDLENSLENMRHVQTQYSEVKSELEKLKIAYDNDIQNIKKLEYIKDSKDSYNIEHLRDEYQKAKEKEKTLSEEIYKDKAYFDNLKNQKETLTKYLAEHENWINSNKNSASLKKLLLDEENTNKDISSLEQSRAIKDNRIEDFELKILSLKKGSDQCPTCDTPLQDVASLVDSFVEAVQLEKDSKVKISETILEKRHTLENLKGQIEKARIYQTRVAERDTAITTLDEVTNALLDQPDLTAKEKELQETTAYKDEVTEKGIKAKNFHEDKSEYERISEAQNFRSSRISELNDNLNRLIKQFSEEEYTRLRNMSIELQNNIEKEQENVNLVVSEYMNYQNRLAQAETQLENLQSQWDRKQELLTAQEKKALTTELIDKFRRESVAALAPEISEHATELISDITNGAYIEVIVDDDFNVSVVNSSGQRRETSILSGGEESAVAFSLRLAIAFLITGGNPSLLWLDEPLTAQDEERRSSMLTTIRSLPIEQIVMINHAGDATEVVDKSVFVIASKDGSTLQNEEGEEDYLDEEDETDGLSRIDISDFLDVIPDSNN